MYVLTFKVRELLILCYVVLMFIDLFIDLGESLLANPSDAINRFGETL